MKKQNGKNPYANNGGGRIEAPNRPENEPKGTVRIGTDDLRK